jgi:hypothetical protein
MLRAKLPVNLNRAGGKRQAIVARAFEGAGNLVPWERLQFVERKRRRFGHHAGDVEPPGFVSIAGRL